jgi:hypothetical protein
MDRRPAPIAGRGDPGQVARDDHAHRQHPTTEAQKAGSQTRDDDHAVKKKKPTCTPTLRRRCRQRRRPRPSVDNHRRARRRPRRRLPPTTTTTICRGPVTTTTLKPKKKHGQVPRRRRDVVPLHPGTLRHVVLAARHARHGSRPRDRQGHPLHRVGPRSGARRPGGRPRPKQFAELAPLSTRSRRR